MHYYSKVWGQYIKFFKKVILLFYKLNIFKNLNMWILIKLSKHSYEV